VSARILVVDDDPTNLKLARRVLEGGGYRVETAPDVASALAAADRFRPHLVLTDIELPGEDGRVLARRLRARADGGGGLAVVALSGHPERDAADFDGWLRKPVEPDALLAAIGGFIASVSRRSLEGGGGAS
jgi:CheY-like chemotaxis protein